MSADAATMTAEARRLNASAVRALAARNFDEARALLSQAIGLDPSNPSLHLNLAASHRATDQIEEAMKAVSRALELEPRNFMALLMRASLLERQGAARRAASAYGTALLMAPPEGMLDPATRAAVSRARDLNRRYLAELEDYVLARLETSGGPAKETKRAKTFLEITLGKRKTYRQEPAQYFYPGLPAIEFWDRDEFPWLQDLEAAAPVMRSELSALLQEGDKPFEPYTNYADGLPLDQWAELNRSFRWSAFHFWHYGEAYDANQARCPGTMQALAAVPQPKIQKRCPAAMFSVLKPRTRIPPHTGVANFRLVVHLPLIVPAKCGFRVGAETREWKPGEAFVFDDTIEHEAWNDSDEVRVVFICDTWNPRLNEGERAAIVETIEAMDDFNGIVDRHADM